jgi:UDP-N-acetylglucosamine 2-epimerase (non-hydrolysing)
MKKKIVVIFGTRPEFIKLLPLIIYLNKSKSSNVIVCNSSQHVDLIKPFLNYYKLKIHYNFNVLKKNQSLSYLSAQLLKKTDDLINKISPDCVVVQGDTSTAFIASLSSFYNKIKVFHVEAGLRTYNINSPWPEEINRQYITKLSTHHFAPTTLAKKNLIAEGINRKDITLTGNTVIDLLFLTIKSFNKNINCKKNLKKRFIFLEKNKFKILISVHRRENFGKPLKEICLAINELAKNNNFQIIFCIHSNPNVVNSKKKYLLNKKNIFQIKSLNYINFIYLMNNVNFIMSDSGGIQEEAPSLGKPNLILREFTERPEAIKQGSAILVPLRKKDIIFHFKNVLNNKKLLKNMTKKRNIYGDGKSSEIIGKKIIQLLEKSN